MTGRNYHTHTTFCDGRSTVEEVVEAAVSKGMLSLGFSGHSHTDFDDSFCMSHSSALVYRRTVMSLAEKYADRIEILCGLEYDVFSDEVKSWEKKEALWDYLIGSAHYIKADGEYLPVDLSAEATSEIIDLHFGGDAFAYCEAYFQTVADVCEVTGCDIIGHFDLITKFNEGGAMWNEGDERYIAAYNKALDRLIPFGVPFEINTGAMTRGFRSEPYPSRAILEEIFSRGGRVALSSDSHEAETVDGYLDVAAALARDIGFDRYTVMSRAGAEELPL